MFAPSNNQQNPFITNYAGPQQMQGGFGGMKTMGDQGWGPQQGQQWGQGFGGMGHSGGMAGEGFGQWGGGMANRGWGPQGGFPNQFGQGGGFGNWQRPGMFGAG